MSSLRNIALLLALTASFALSEAATPKDYEASILAWRAKRVERLTAPAGWLSLVGLDWLKTGELSIGSGKDNAVVLPKGPDRLGILKVDTMAKSVSLHLEAAGAGTVDGEQFQDAVLKSDASGKPSLVRVGSLSFTVISRGEKLGLRVRDSEAEARVHFQGIESFPIAPNWRIEARWIPFEAGHTIQVTNVLGQIAPEKAPGKAVFEVAGKSYELIPTQEEPGEPLFFVLRDLTSGKETYGASRFLDADAPKDGKVILDFNQLTNPPCAFSDYATCPLPIPENRLQLAITAGEKKYLGHSEH